MLNKQFTSYNNKSNNFILMDQSNVIIIFCRLFFHSFFFCFLECLLVFKVAHFQFMFMFGKFQGIYGKCINKVYEKRKKRIKPIKLQIGNKSYRTS